MDKLKLIFIGLGVLFTAIVLYFAVTIVMSLFWYLIIFGVVALGAYGAYKFLSRPQSPPQLVEQNRAERELANAQKALKDFQRKIESGEDRKVN